VRQQYFLFGLVLQGDGTIEQRSIFDGHGISDVQVFCIQEVKEGFFHLRQLR
jgi:hypothetical protein